MDKINFFLWRADMIAQGEEGNTLIANFLGRASEIIERDINRNGGIAGKPVTIKQFRAEGDEDNRYNQIIRRLEEQTDTLFFNTNERLLKGIDRDAYICFGSISSGEAKHPNVFNLSRVSRQTKINGAIQIIKNHPEKSKVLFIHDGKRSADYEQQFIDELGSKFRAYNFSEFKEEPDITAELKELFSQIDGDCILILDVGLRVFKHIFDHLNETGTQTLVIKFFGNFTGRFDRIGFPLISFGTDFSFMSLDFEGFLRETEIELTDIERTWVRIASANLEYPLLAAYAARQSSVVYENREQFLRDMATAINRIDGKRDLFVGKRFSYAFKDNENIIKTNYTYQFPLSLQSDGAYPPILYRNQYFAEDEGIKPTQVSYIYIDILRVNNIDVGNGTWSTELNLDIVSPYNDPIEIIKFNNLSAIKPKFESKLIRESEPEANGLITCRYYVVANFDFISVADNYPFDWQHIFISYALVDPEKYGVIQPIPEALLDRQFKIDGWILKESITGILQKKQTIYEGDQLRPKTMLALDPRVGWILARANSVTLMKIGIPLSFLLFLNYYTLFMEFKDIGGSVGILTTAFLAGIALYFSTERPQPLRMTTVDLIFLWYYMLTGIIIVVTSVSSLLGAKIFFAAVIGLKFIVPLGVIGICVFLLRRIKSNRLKPRIN